MAGPRPPRLPLVKALPPVDTLPGKHAGLTQAHTHFPDYFIKDAKRETSLCRYGYRHDLWTQCCGRQVRLPPPAISLAFFDFPSAMRAIRFDPSRTPPSIMLVIPATMKEMPHGTVGSKKTVGRSVGSMV